MMKTNRPTRLPTATITRTLLLLLIISLVESASEERINNRGNKASNFVDKVNGWRSQRGGSCLSYGHSCWGAHGKRSGKSPTSAPDWYLARLLRRMIADNDLDSLKVNSDSGDLNAIYRADFVDDAPPRTGKQINQEESRADLLGPKRSLERIPMLDDDALTKTKLWQMMKAASEN